jgi:RHS repeat-associated protein
MAKANPFRFSTKYQDDETDLLYYGYRFYKPTAGTWLNRDPKDELGLAALTQPRGFWRPGRRLNVGAANLYAFLSNNPQNNCDRLGLDAADLDWLNDLFYLAMNNYCAQHVHCNCPDVGNILALLPWTPYKGCTKTVVDMNQRIYDSGFPYYSDDPWKITTSQIWDPFPHNRNILDSSTITVIMDPWYGCIKTHYKDGSFADGIQCYRCQSKKAVLDDDPWIVM